MDIDSFRIIRFATIAITFIVSIIYWQRYKHSQQRYFPVYMGFVLLIECLATINVRFWHSNPTHIYLIYTNISVLYFLNWFKLILERAILPLLSMITFLVFSTLGTISLGISGGILHSLVSAGSILILVNSFAYFMELLRSNEVIRFLRLQQFWIVAGLVLFYIGFFPVHILQPYVSQNKFWITLFITILNVLQYGFFTISFLCLKRKS